MVPENIKATVDAAFGYLEECHYRLADDDEAAAAALESTTDSFLASQAATVLRKLRYAPSYPSPLPPAVATLGNPTVHSPAAASASAETGLVTVREAVNALCALINRELADCHTLKDSPAYLPNLLRTAALWLRAQPWLLSQESSVIRIRLLQLVRACMAFGIVTDASGAAFPDPALSPPAALAAAQTRDFAAKASLAQPVTDYIPFLLASTNSWLARRRFTRLLASSGSADSTVSSADIWRVVDALPFTSPVEDAIAVVQQRLQSRATRSETFLAVAARVQAILRPRSSGHALADKSKKVKWWLSFFERSIADYPPAPATTAMLIARLQSVAKSCAMQRARALDLHKRGGSHLGPFLAGQDVTAVAAPRAAVKAATGADGDEHHDDDDAEEEGTRATSRAFSREHGDIALEKSTEARILRLIQLLSPLLRATQSYGLSAEVAPPPSQMAPASSCPLPLVLTRATFPAREYQRALAKLWLPAAPTQSKKLFIPHHFGPGKAITAGEICSTGAPYADPSVEPVSDTLQRPRCRQYAGLDSVSRSLDAVVAVVDGVMLQWDPDHSRVELRDEFESETDQNGNLIDPVLARSAGVMTSSVSGLLRVTRNKIVWSPVVPVETPVKGQPSHQEDPEGRLTLVASDILHWTFGTLPASFTSSALNNADDGGAGGAGGAGGSAAAAGASGLIEATTNTGCVYGMASDEDAATFLTLHSGDGAFRLFPFRASEMAGIVDLLRDVLGTEPYTEKEFVAAYLDTKVGRRRLEVLQAITSGPSPWLAHTRDLHRTIQRLTAPGRAQSLAEMERLFHSCRRSDAVAKSTIAELKRAWHGATLEPVRIKVLTVASRLLDPAVVRTSNSTYQNLTAWLASLESGLDPYKSPMSVRMVHELLKKAVTVRQQLISPVSHAQLPEVCDDYVRYAAVKGWDPNQIAVADYSQRHVFDTAVRTPAMSIAPSRAQSAARLIASPAGSSMAIMGAAGTALEL
jgi:hypothetical protein